jgi:F0F1-type ATP synthase membrane subunit b/b'
LFPYKTIVLLLLLLLLVVAVLKPLGGAFGTQISYVCIATG